MGSVPETTPNIGSSDKSVGWFDKDLPNLQPAAVELLEKYAGIAPEEVVNHVLAMREKAWAVWPYPCIGMYRFLDLHLMRLPCYPRILDILRPGTGRLLDVGCCVAQDLRKLIFDGVPSSSLYGAELNAPFFDLGYELFRDRDTCAAHFRRVNMLDGSAWSTDAEDVLADLKGTVDVVHLGMVLHVFSLEQQKFVLERSIRMLKPGKGALIVGQAVGHTEGFARQKEVEGGYSSFKHNVETFKKLIGEVEESTGVKLEVKADLDKGLGVDNGKREWDNDGGRIRRLYFEIETI